MSPSSVQATTTTRMPAIAALAGLVPCAEEGIRQTLRWASPRERVIAADGEQPGIFALAAGVGLQRDGVEAGDLGQPALRARRSWRDSPAHAPPARTDAGWRRSAQLTGIISAAALSFIVQEPSGIMARSSARSLSASRRRKRIISVSERFSWKTGCVRNFLPRGFAGQRRRAARRPAPSRRTARRARRDQPRSRSRRS